MCHTSCYPFICECMQAHERSLNTDILFGLLKKIRKRLPELRIIISSATVDALIVKQFFESNRHKGEVVKDDTFILQLQVSYSSMYIYMYLFVYVTIYVFARVYIKSIFMYTNLTGAIVSCRHILSPRALSQLPRHRSRPHI